jgi:hypothetical protein
VTGTWFNAKLRHIVVSILLFVAGATGACRSAARSESHHTEIGWRPIASFSGRGDSQTESFDIDSTQWRIKWETKGAVSPGTGFFHVVVHSAVSGRPIMDALQHHGNGHGIVFVTEDPRLYHLVIESNALDWSVTAEEAVVGTPR